MKVNCKKTQLLMVAPPNGCDNRSFIKLENETIKSEDSLKLLDFMFGRDPNVAEHVSLIKKKFRGRFWSLIHLRNNGFKGDELMNLFNVFLRPVIEYCSAVYHSMLTKGQEKELERMQRQAVKLAYGWNESYEDICVIKNIKTLKERREEYVDRFVAKTIQSERFRCWYPRRNEPEHEFRRFRAFEEYRSSTLRYYNSPMAFMRRRANDLFPE